MNRWSRRDGDILLGLAGVSLQGGLERDEDSQVLGLLHLRSFTWRGLLEKEQSKCVSSGTPGARSVTAPPLCVSLMCSRIHGFNPNKAKETH